MVAPERRGRGKAKDTGLLPRVPHPTKPKPGTVSCLTDGRQGYIKLGTGPEMGYTAAQQRVSSETPPPVQARAS